MSGRFSSFRSEKEEQAHEENARNVVQNRSWLSSQGYKRDKGAESPSMTVDSIHDPTGIHYREAGDFLTSNNRYGMDSSNKTALGVHQNYVAASNPRSGNFVRVSHDIGTRTTSVAHIQSSAYKG